MNSQHDPEREDDLRALFERTREDPDRMQLTKLRARAEDVPALARRGRRWLALAPLFAVALGALAVFFATRGNQQSLVAPSTSVALVDSRPELAPGPSVAPAPEPTALAQGSAEPDDALLEPDDVAPVATLDDPSADDPLAALDEPADDDVDTWLNATSSFLEGG